MRIVGNKLQGLSAKTIWVVMIGFVILFYWQKQYFVDSDLGRHLKNGEIIIRTKSVPKTNLYSYTEPDRQVVAHHMGAGVIYYLVFRVVGFEGLHLMTIAVYVGAIMVAMQAAALTTGSEIVMLTTLLSLPLIVWRNEIRPESFSYLMFSVYLLILFGAKKGLSRKSWLWVLPLLQIVWVNLHIYFVLGIGLVGLFWMGALVNSEFKLIKTCRWALVTGLVIMASVINPFGISGLLAPLTLKSENLSRVVEIQTVFELLNHFDRMDFVQFVAVFGVAIYGIVEWRKKLELKENLIESLLLLVFGVLGMMMVRNMALFGLVFITAGSKLVEDVVKKFKNRSQKAKKSNAWIEIVIVVMILSGLVKHDWYYSPFKSDGQLGLGLRDGSLKAGEFLWESGVKGPIYNNFDIGGYLIYFLYPKEKVFIDNRPEAYGEKFFSEEYIQMHQHEGVWATMEARYGFEAIVASYQDVTTWLKPFLIRRHEDPTWALVYQDENVVVMVKREGVNRELVKKYEI